MNGSGDWDSGAGGAECKKCGCTEGEHVTYQGHSAFVCVECGGEMVEVVG